MKIILITGASSGIGYATAKTLAKQGHKVYGGARRIERMEGLREYGVIPLKLDVTNDESAKMAVDTIIEAEGRIDVLINNAGYGSYGPLEVTPLSEAQRQLDVNVLGVARMMSLVLPVMRKHNKGHIINISSIAGRVTMPFGGWYHASKYAVESLSDATRMDVSDFGIDVSIIEPAGIASEWGIITADNLDNVIKNTAYETEARKISNLYRNIYSKKNPMVGSVDDVAEVLSKAVNSKRPKTRYHVGPGASAIIFMHSILPTRMFDWLVKNIMMKLGR